MSKKLELPRVGDKKIDTIHDEEHQLLESFLELVESGSDDEVTKMFNRFIDHMQMHFEHEEALMDRSSGYSFKELHKGEHYKVISDARYKLMNWQNSKDRWDLKDYLEYEFVEWLKQHIPAMDVVMVEHFKSEGLV